MNATEYKTRAKELVDEIISLTKQSLEIGGNQTCTRVLIAAYILEAELNEVNDADVLEQNQNPDYCIVARLKGLAGIRQSSGDDSAYLAFMQIAKQVSELESKIRKPGFHPVGE